MSRPEAIRVDAREGRVDWEQVGAARHALVEGAVDARYDPAGDRIVVLTRTTGRDAVVSLSTCGETMAVIASPDGYRLSHFADPVAPVLVGQGEAAVDGWQDWHFEVDEAGRGLRRLGPAY